MIRELQIKFVVIIMVIMTIVLLCIFGLINVSMIQSGERQSIGIMREIARNEGAISYNRNPRDPSLSFEKNRLPMPQTFFTVKLNYNNEILGIISSKNLNLTDEEIVTLVNTVFKNEKNLGKQENFHYLVEPKPYGSIVVFLDNSIEMNMIYRLFWISVGIGFISLVIIFFVAIYLSSWAIKPVKKAFNAQKQFVADASHELKTPLATIATNVDVLSNEMGQNKWLDYIQMEVQRMNVLVNNLLYLAKADSVENIYQRNEFDLSNAMMSACLPFESVAYENTKNLLLDIPEHAYYTGDENRIKQVVAILVDNAIKNSNENGQIKVSLIQHNGKRIITVYNTGDGIDEKEKEKIFIRFYREDSSRVRKTGGYGLGLSIAKTIIDAHKGKITMEGEKGKWISFIVTL